jgi:hypothetical protein
MSETTSWRPLIDPGVMPLPIPLPKVIEHADPGGVSCTTRNVGLKVRSTSTWKPHFSS